MTPNVTYTDRSTKPHRLIRATCRYNFQKEVVVELIEVKTKMDDGWEILDEIETGYSGVARLESILAGKFDQEHQGED